MFLNRSGRSGTLSEGLGEGIVSRLQELLPTTAVDILDSFIITLTSVSSALSGKPTKTKILDLLLELYFNQETTIHTSVNAFPVLRAALKTHKQHVLAWSARLMCSGTFQPQMVLEYLLLLCMDETDKKQFLTENLRYLLPPIILSSGEKDSTVGIDDALQMIARYCQI